MTELKTELCRCMDALAGLELGTEEHSRVIGDVDRLMRLIWHEEEVNQTREDQPERGAASLPEDEDTPALAETWEPGGGEAVEAEPPAEETTPEPAPAPTLTKDEVKAKLLALSSKCDALELSAVMEGMGYGKLSEIPSARYYELLTRAEEAVKELEAI